MLMSEGIREYVEPHCVQRELAEVTGLTADELDHAAHELIRRTASDPTSSCPAAAVSSRPASGVPAAPPHRPPYYEHLGGYSFDELKDYNRHSPVHEESLPPVRPPLPGSTVPGSTTAGGGGTSSTAAAAAAAAFRAGGLRTRVYRSVTAND